MGQFRERNTRKDMYIELSAGKWKTIQRILSWFNTGSMELVSAMATEIAQTLT